MTWDAVAATALLLASLAAQHLWLRPRLRRRVAAIVGRPIMRRLRNARASLAALSRAAHLRPHRPAHALSSPEGHRHDDDRLAA